MKNFGMGNFQNIMRQAQKLQAELNEQMQKAEEELQNTVLTATSGGGMVTVKMNGKKEIKEVKINPQVVDPDDVEMLEDLILSCANDAINQANQLEDKLKPKMPNGMF